MNDAELDELLNIWKAPPPRESLREGVRVGIRARRRRPPRRLVTRWRLGAVAAVVIVGFLLANSSGFSEKVGPPYTVDSKIIHYDGWDLGGGPQGRPWNVAASPESPLLTSYNQAGSEVILSWSSPDHPLEAALWKARLAVSGAVDRLTEWFLSIVERLDPRIVTPPDEEADAFAVVYPGSAGINFIVGRRASLLSSGCRTSHGGSEVVVQEVILNYPTTVVQQEFGGGRWMMTLWMAPELSCFALRATIQRRQPDGSWKLVNEKKALKVTVNR